MTPLVYGHFHTASVELSSCSKDHIVIGGSGQITGGQDRNPQEPTLPPQKGGACRKHRGLQTEIAAAHDKARATVIKATGLREQRRSQHMPNEVMPYPGQRVTAFLCSAGKLLSPSTKWWPEKGQRTRKLTNMVGTHMKKPGTQLCIDFWAESLKFNSPGNLAFLLPW